jgi:Ca2+-binding EF-hand superfamily protein
MNCFATLSDVHAMSRGQASHLEAVVRHLFETFDADGNGVIDLAELSSGLSVL